MLLILLALAAFLGAEARPPTYVLNGETAKQGQYPFAAWITTCSASILDKRTILTAGHCVCRTRPTSILLGAVQGRNPETGSKRYSLDTSKQQIHPDYRSCGTVGPDDVAILKTTTDIEFTEFIQPIALHQGETSVGQDITVSGYGQDENRRSGVLKFAHSNVVRCVRFQGSICQLMTPNSPYYGDSGGPLFIKNGDKYEQVGTVSGGDFTNNQAIYGNMHRTMAFIKSNME